jgi:DNA-binding GntR family transcriptional regulator
LRLQPAGYVGEVINPRARQPPYEQVGEILKKRIETGEYPKDERIPSEAELMAEFEIGRSTARRAVAWLRDQGLVETEGKRGTYVV